MHILETDLKNIDKKQIDEKIIHSAWCGSMIDFDLVRDSIKNMLLDGISINLGTAKSILDIENGVWSVDNFIFEAYRYADDIMMDWCICGSSNRQSLDDIIKKYIEMIRGVYKKIPERNVEKSMFHENVMKYGSVPKTLIPVKRPELYKYGDGHLKSEDPVLSDLVRHVIEDECALKIKINQKTMLDGFKKHKMSGCKYFPRKHKIGKRYYTPQKTTTPVQKSKDSAIFKFLNGLDYKKQYIHKEGTRHSILLYGKSLDIPYIYNEMDKLAMEYTPIDCFVTNDKFNENMQYITRMKNGLRFTPAMITVHQLLFGLEDFGFGLYVAGKINDDGVRYGPEYTITSTFLVDNSSRLYLNGVAATLFKNEINWDLMMYLSRTWGFSNTLLGILTELSRYNGKKFKYPIKTLRDSGSIPLETEKDTIYDTLRIYAQVKNKSS